MILIVDDKKENILSLESLLSLHSYPVDTAMSGEEALKKILKKNYTLIILDVQMPGMDGFEVAETISGFSKVQDVPVIFLSAVNTDKNFIAKGYSSGAIDYITKPIDPDILLLKVKTLYSIYEQKRKLNEMQAKLQSEVEFRKKAQYEANEKAKELKSILESIPQIAFTTTANGEIEYHNSQWLNYTDTGGTSLLTHPDDPSLEEELKKMAGRKEPLEMEIRLKKPEDKDYRYYLLRVLPVRENGSILKWTGTFTEIEEQKQALQRKDEFISMASHELKTPLTSIQGYVQLLQQMVSDENLGKYIDRAVIQVKKLDNLVSDLLDISKIESGKLKMNMKDFSFGPMLDTTISIMQETYPGYTIEHTGNANAIVYGDESRLEQVIINFLANAIKYAPESRLIKVETGTINNRLSVKVTDYGVGIPKEEQPYIFDKFYRTKDSLKNFQGLGLGLYICADILSRHNCEYGVESEPGKGSTFYFRIPIVKK
jgi:signal transduction histidine kinase/DNA-binding response OmpR family regulator